MRSLKSRDSFRVVAILSAYNEADIISQVIGHSVENGVEVYLIDNHSTDGTVEQARPWLGRGLIGIEEFPEEKPAGGGPAPFDWGAILERKEKLAKEIRADWFLHQDADEIREAPWPGMSLKDGIRWVDRLGYNCVDFRVLNFPPTGGDFEPGTDPATHFKLWEEPVVFDRVQLKCWKAGAGPVSLAATGGHEVRFPDRRLFPISFLLRHYPIRSQEHGRRKVFEERKSRFLEKERAKGWHVQYDGIVDDSHSFLTDPLRLHPFDADGIRLELMLQNRVTREAEASLDERGRELTGLREQHALLAQETAQLRGIRAELERHASGLEADRRKLTDHITERERHVANLEGLKAQLERHATQLQEDRDRVARRVEDLERSGAERERHLVNLENIRGELERHATGLEKDRETLARYIADRDKHVSNLENIRAELEKDRATLTQHIANVEKSHASLLDRVAETEREKVKLEADLRAMRSSTIWRWTKPIRLLLDGVKRLVRGSTRRSAE